MKFVIGYGFVFFVSFLAFYFLKEMIGLTLALNKIRKINREILESKNRLERRKDETTQKTNATNYHP